MEISLTSRERDKLLKICDKLRISESSAVVEGVRLFICHYCRVLDL